jgi:hypothetical protein
MQPTGMADPLAGATVEQNLSAHCGQEVGDPLASAQREAKLLQQFNQECPSNCVEGFHNVNLEEDTWALVNVQELGYRLDR